MSQIESITLPSYTIDPQRLRRFDERKTAFGRRMWDTSAEFYGQGVYDRAPDLIRQHLPGHSRLEFARASASWTVSDQFRGAYSWEKLGSPDPATVQLGQYVVEDCAETSAQIKETARIYGADLVGICQIDRRWVYAQRMSGQSIDIPPEYNYAVVMAVKMDGLAIQASPGFLAETATGVGYSRMAFAISCLAEFIRNLGYRAIPMGNDTALSIPLAIDAGLGELGRNGLLVTQEYGPCVRLCKVFTDLPLEPDRPAPFGLVDTCRRCRQCADACAAGAISSGREPSYKTVCPSNNEGILRWAVNHDKCYSFWVENGASCSSCIAACPFSQRV